MDVGLQAHLAQAAVHRPDCQMATGADDIIRHRSESPFGAYSAMGVGTDLSADERSQAEHFHHQHEQQHDISTAADLNNCSRLRLAPDCAAPDVFALPPVAAAADSSGELIFIFI